MPDKEIFVVTHGEKATPRALGNGRYSGDPGLTAYGFTQIQALKHLVPRTNCVPCGEGQRHFDVAKALGLTPTRCTGVLGTGASLEVINGVKTILLPNGETVDPACYTTLEDLTPATPALIVSLPHNAVICAGRPSMIMLGVKDAKSAAVYKITVVAGEIKNIKEVIATGESEEGTV